MSRSRGSRHQSKRQRAAEGESATTIARDRCGGYSAASQTPEGGIQCCKCCKSIPTDVDRVKLEPCGHVLCVFCALESHSLRGCKQHKCTVSGCSNPITNHNRYIFAADGSSRVLNTTIDEQEMRHNTPLEWLKKTHRNEIKASGEHQAVVLYCAKVQLKEGCHDKIKTDTTTSTFVLRVTNAKGGKKSYEVINDMRALIEVGNFFSVLHHPIACASMDPEGDLPVLSPRELLEMRCFHPRLLDRALFAMGTGRNEFNSDEYLCEDQQDYQKQYLAAISSTDILLRNLRKTPGHLQLMFHQLFLRQRTTQDFRDLCSSFNFATSRSFSLSKRAKDALKKLKSGIKLKPRDLTIIYFDNIGFKVLGRHAGYDQWVVIHIVVFTEEQLKAAGFYNDNNPESQISRAPTRIWADVTKGLNEDAKRQLALEVIGVNEADYDCISMCILENIKYVIDFNKELVLCYQEKKRYLPRFDKIIDEASRCEMETLFRNGDRARLEPEQSSAGNGSDLEHHSITIPRGHIPDDVENELGGAGLLDSVRDCDGMQSDDVDGGDDTNAKNNRYKQNNSCLQVNHVDLSESSTVEAILQYHIRSRDQQLADWEAERQKYPDTAEPPLAEVMIGFGCDGQPAAQMRKIMLDNARFGGEYPNDAVWVSHGGLHTVMKTLNASGETFFDLLDTVWEAVRTTVEKRMWIIAPTDPRQREQDASKTILAHYAEAERNLRMELDRDVTAVEVNAFMIERAKEYPICALALLELRMATVAKLMRHAEHVGGKDVAIKLFFTSIKFALPLFAITHKTDYVFLCQELLKQWHCASPAQRIIYSHFIFTRKTSRGTSIFHDFLVELDVMNIRGDLGKVWRKGHDLSMELVASELPDRPAQSTNTRDLHNNLQAQQPLQSNSRTQDVISNDISCAYFGVSERIGEMCLWVKDAIPCIKGKEGKFNLQCKSNVLEVTTGGQLHAMILSSITHIGTERVIDSFVKYCIDEPNVAQRSDKTVDMTKLDTTANNIDRSLKRVKTLRLSTTAADFDDRFFTKDKLLSEIEALKRIEHEREEEIEELLQVTIPRVEDKKGTIVESLIKWRKKMFKKYPDLHKDLSKAIKNDAVNKARSTRESRDELMSEPLFALSESVRNKSRYN